MLKKRIKIEFFKYKYYIAFWMCYFIMRAKHNKKNSKNKNIENKLKYFEKCVDKCTSMYYIRLNKRETEQPNKEGWERSTKESIEREV